MCWHRLCAYDVTFIVAHGLGAACRHAAHIESNESWSVLAEVKKEMVIIIITFIYIVASIGPSRYAVAAWASHAESDRWA